MAEYVVKQGDCLASIAKKFGFPDWRVIYNHPQNASFKKKRPNPNIIHPGDALFIPDASEKTEDCATAQKHSFVLTRQRVMLRLVMKDQQGTALADKKYILVVDGTRFDGQTEASGLIEHEIPADASEGTLELRPQDDDKHYFKWKLRLGALDPIEELSGVQARLTNLGFFSGQVDGLMGPKTRTAIEAFQKAHGLQQTGSVGPKTRELLEAHDSL